jgi:O-methyltransferase
MLRALAKRVLRSLGFRLVRLPGDAEYGIVSPIADYCPWNADPVFSGVFRNIATHTLVDIYRCWELWQLVGQTTKMEPGAILEVGVWRGGTGALMAKRAEMLGVPDPVYLCDGFEGVPKAGGRDTHYKGGEHADTSQVIVENLLSSLGISNARIVRGIFPESADQIPADARFRLCHIDVDVYQSGKEVTEWIWDRLVPGGIIVYDDYGFQECDGIKNLVNEQAVLPGGLWLHNLNGHAVAIRLPWE